MYTNYSYGITTARLAVPMCRTTKILYAPNKEKKIDISETSTTIKALPCGRTI